MPTSTRQQIAHLRKRWTGEPMAYARTGIGRDGEMFDRMSSEQVSFRAHLALHLYDSGDPFTGTISCYTLSTSPQYEELVWLSDAPSNLAGYVARMHMNWRSIKEDPKSGGVVFTDALTNGRLRIRDLTQPSSTYVSHGAHRDFEAMIIGQAVCRQHRVHPGSPDAQVLFGALVSRYALASIHGPNEMTTSFFLSGKSVLKPARIDLMGTWDDWSLDWDGRPRPEALVHALTDSVIGLPGASVSWTNDRAVVRYGTAQLRLKPTGC